MQPTMAGTLTPFPTHPSLMLSLSLIQPECRTRCISSSRFACRDKPEETKRHRSTHTLQGPYVAASESDMLYPAHAAAGAGDAQRLAAVLLQHHQHLNAKDEHGRTPIFHAIAHKHMACVEV